MFPLEEKCVEYKHTFSIVYMFSLRPCEGCLLGAVRVLSHEFICVISCLDHHPRLWVSPCPGQGVVCTIEGTMHRGRPRFPKLLHGKAAAVALGSLNLSPMLPPSQSWPTLFLWIHGGLAEVRLAMWPNRRRRVQHAGRRNRERVGGWDGYESWDHDGWSRPMEQAVGVQIQTIL